jgi:hypothetical protein
MMNNQRRIEYLESLLPVNEEKLEKKYWSLFERQAMYLGNGIYKWCNVFSNDTRELWLMGV